MPSASYGNELLVMALSTTGQEASSNIGWVRVGDKGLGTNSTHQFRLLSEKSPSQEETYFLI